MLIKIILQMRLVIEIIFSYFDLLDADVEGVNVFST
jgi:hypothetical protein